MLGCVKYSLVVAIDNKECIASELYDKGAVNADRFNEFLTKICNKVKVSFTKKSHEARDFFKFYFFIN
jgi:hypothetical protein